MLIIVVFIILLAYWIAAQYHKNRELNAKLKNIPETKSAYPILGEILHIWSIMKWPHHEKMNYLIEMIQSYPTTFKVRLGPKVLIIINNLEDIKTILTSPHCTDKSSMYHMTIGGDGLFVANGDKWKNQRRHLNNTFSLRVINSYTNEFNQFGRNIVAALEKHAISGKEFDITPKLGIYVTDLITRTVYGSTQHKIELSKHCYEVVERLMIFWGERMAQIYMHFFSVIVRKIFRISSEDKKLNKQLRSGLQPMLDEKVEKYHNNINSIRVIDNNPVTGVKNEHFLEKLTRLRFEGIIGLSEYRHTSMTMFLAGVETTAHGISIIILMLAIHEEHQQKIYDEICNFYDEYGYDDIDISKLCELNLLDRFVKETFRIFPVVPFFGRTPSRDIPIQNGIIPAGTDVFISVVNLHQYTAIWGDDPMQFNPDHFLPEAVANRDKCSYIPFSYGPRNCIGYKFAQNSVYIGIIHLLKNYQFKTQLKFEDIKIGYGMTSYLMNDNLVTIQPRNYNNNK